MKNLFLVLFLASFASACSRSEAGSPSENVCTMRYVYQKQCIVCSKGGVSCKWD